MVISTNSGPSTDVTTPMPEGWSPPPKTKPSSRPAKASTSRLPRFILLKATAASGGSGKAYYKKDGSVFVGEENVFSTTVKIEAEQSKKDAKYVNLRFCYSNKYWRLKTNDRVIVASLSKPDEDTTKATCTLFEPKVDEKGVFFTHVQSGGRVSIDASTKAIYVGQATDSDTEGYLHYINWESLVKLPRNVAFKGYNDNWLGAVWSKNVPYLQFSVDDPNTPITTYKIQQLPDGHVRIYSNYFNRYLRRSDNEWVVGDASDNSLTDKDTLFWPARYGSSTGATSNIVLRNAANKQFCICLDSDNKTRCLNAGAPNMTKAANLHVQELVSDRKIYNVRYRIEDSRIYKETPFLAGTTTVYNYGSKEAGISVELSYEDTESYSFTHGNTVAAGVSTSFEGGIPFIAQGGIEVSFEVGFNFEWNMTTTTTKSVTATGSVPVPPKTKAVVHYVGTKAKCDVPFSYTQQDTSSTDGTIKLTDVVDGIFIGVNSYNFSFDIAATQAL